MTAMRDGPIWANRGVLAAAMVGSSVEFYDFFVYATAAAIVFGPLFFSSLPPSEQTSLSLLTFGAAFVARPLGAIAFGHFGDRIGRKATLVAALFTMGISTLLIAFLPTYSQIGWWAPLLLTLLRFGQGLGLGGEWGGAALLAVENAPKGWTSRFGAAPQLGAPIGMIMANGVFLIMGMVLPQQEFLEWGWRVPFLLSAMLVMLGLWVRLRISETPAFKAAMARQAPVTVPLASLLSDHFGKVVAGACGAIASFAGFYLTTAFALAFATTQMGFPKQTFLAVQMAANLFYAAGIVLGARQADAMGAGKTIGMGALSLAVVGLFFGPGLAFGSLALAGLTLCAAMVVLGFQNAALGPWLASLFPVPVRYSGISLAFNVGGLIGGALTPQLAQHLSTHGHANLTGMLMSLGGLITWAAVRHASEIDE